MGKIQMAVRYVEQRWAQQPLDLLIWVSVTSKDAILSGDAETAVQILDKGATAPQQAAERLFAWVAATDRTWLVALDDLQDVGDVRGLWPPSAGSGQVLITTRRRDANLTRLGPTVVDVDVFTPEGPRRTCTARSPATRTSQTARPKSRPTSATCRWPSRRPWPI